MKILITSFSYPCPEIDHFGGKFVAAEACSYQINGADVKVLTPMIQGGNANEVTEEGVKIIRFRYVWPHCLQILIRPNRPIYSQLSFLRVCLIPFLLTAFSINIIREARWADVIHSQWTLTALLALPAKWIFKTRIVVTARGSDIRILPKWLNKFIHHSVDAAIDCFGPQQWNNEYKKQFTANYIKLPMIVDNTLSTQNSDDIDRIRENNPNAFIILYIGRFHYRKISNLELPLIDLIYAAKQLKNTNCDFHLVYLGDGDAYDEMLGLIDQLSLDDRVSILGPKTNVFDYIMKCQLGVGGVAFNGVSQEFLISGLPQILVIGNHNKNTPWKDRVNAIMVKGRDVENLVDTLQWAITHRSEIEAIGKRAKSELSYLLANPLNGGREYLREFKKLEEQG